MARDPKIEVAAINIRISEEFDRDYPELITKLAALRKGVRVFGDSYVAISQFDKNTNIGVFSKYTEIDINGEWFDIDSFDVAAPEKIEEINIPKNLRPNYAAFYFQLDPDLHVVAFATYSDSKGLSARSVEKYFEQALMAPEIHGVYGRVEADSIKSYEEVEKILSLPDLRELQLIIRPPNTDDIGPNFARIIEDRLRAQNADEYAEILRSRDAGSLTPNDRTHQLGSGPIKLLACGATH